jgi:hypothetical protein
VFPCEPFFLILVAGTMYFFSTFLRKWWNWQTR